VLTAATAATLYPLQDAYLADPTLDNLKAVLMAAPRAEESWIKNKFLAVQMANFLFRQQASGDTYLTKLTAGDSATTGQPYTPFPVVTGANLNSIWMVGANQRDFIHNVGGALPVGPASGNQGKFSVPKDSIPGLSRNDANEQLQRIIVPWFWLGFTLDPSTMNVEADYVAEGDEYFTQETFVDNGSSPIHGAFIVSKRSLEIMKYTTLPRSPERLPVLAPRHGSLPGDAHDDARGLLPDRDELRRAEELQHDQQLPAHVHADGSGAQGALPDLRREPVAHVHVDPRRRAADDAPDLEPPASCRARSRRPRSS